MTDQTADVEPRRAAFLAAFDAGFPDNIPCLLADAYAAGLAGLVGEDGIVDRSAAVAAFPEIPWPDEELRADDLEDVLADVLCEMDDETLAELVGAEEFLTVDDSNVGVMMCSGSSGIKTITRGDVVYAYSWDHEGLVDRWEIDEAYRLDDNDSYLAFCRTLSDDLAVYWNTHSISISADFPEVVLDEIRARAKEMGDPPWDTGELARILEYEEDADVVAKAVEALDLGTAEAARIVIKLRAESPETELETKVAWWIVESLGDRIW